MVCRPSCRPSCDCSITAGTGTTVTGDGNPGNPYVIAADLTVTDTNTMDLNFANGEIRALLKISDDAGNCLTVNADGIFAPCPDGGETHIVAGVGTTVTGTGTPGDPYVIDASGSGDIGVEGCGIDINGSVISIKTNSRWPYACPQSAGAPLYCDPDTGRLMAPPEKFAIARNFRMPAFQGTRRIATLAPADSQPVAVGPQYGFDFTNPSQCRPMDILMRVGVEHAQFAANGRSAEIQIGPTLQVFTLAGPMLQQQMGHQHWGVRGQAFGTAETFDSMGSNAGVLFTIQPGETVFIEAFNEIRVFQNDETNGINTLENWTSFIEVIGMNP